MIGLFESSPPWTAFVPVRLCVAISGTMYWVPCGSNSYATWLPATAVILNCVALVTASAGTTTVIPAAGIERRPPRMPMVAVAVNGAASGVVRIIGCTAVGAPRMDRRERLAAAPAGAGLVVADWS